MQDQDHSLNSGKNCLDGWVHFKSALSDDPFSGHVFVFRGRRGNVIKLLWSTGDGLCLLSKRLEHGRFVWPQATSGKGGAGVRSAIRTRTDA
ncbi:IS66 family insertion sequence element accessory protein TnpB [Janthinobacterium sp. PC23-8]|uniref:IS66 family insertion sequence element accessory protein TnpB n=1 Tax=Janthinobacterium sp. PC23-8 TaxID=2012679 RepID=UPI000B96EC33|nr:IS66 family insertion sequence element accessory protein TnpB [Janthinobacterium sp. PC23-8]OYO26786.1 hypothetical protein CD932_25940 [Janthinobacterium sp. PC23-8]